MTDRLQKAKQRIIQTPPGVSTERLVLVTEAYNQFRGEHPLLLRAKTLSKLLHKMTISINDDELLVGSLSSKIRYAPIYPEFSVQWILDDLDTMSTRKTSPYALSDDDRKIILEYLPKWCGHTSMDQIESSISKQARIAVENKIFNPPFSDAIGHIAVAYWQLIDNGMEYLLAELCEREQSCRSDSFEELEKKTFYRAAQIVCKAIVDFANRYADLADRLAESASERRKNELLEISRICRKIPMHPCGNFHEALQCLWFLHICIQIDTNGHSISPGRIDQYLYKYYQKSIAMGISREELEEQLGSLWIKFNEIVKLSSAETCVAFGGYPMYQNVIVGGVDENACDCTNELSLLCVKVSRQIALPQPSLCMRWHEQTPEPLMHEAALTVKTGIGLPAFFNDKVIIPLLQRIGYTLEEARNYCEVGCVENSVPGITEGEYSAGFINLPKVLELTIFDGVNPVTGIRVTPATGICFSAFEDFYSAYMKQLEYCCSLQAECINVVDHVLRRMAPTPLLSCFVLDCIEKGSDIRSGGARYNFQSPSAIGIVNVSDSMNVIRQKVFTEKKYTINELRHFLTDDYNDSEMIRQEFLNTVPKYGNNNSESDEMFRRVGGDYCLMSDKFKGVQNSTFHYGLQSIAAHVMLSKYVGALPDGKRRAMLLADGGISPAQGRDFFGPTAVLSSAACLNHVVSTNGALLNIKLHPSVVAGEKGLRHIEELVRAYFLMGGQHLQFNVVSSQTLLDAQKHPEKYKDMVIRVAGFSAIFVLLDEKLQNDIIARTENL